MFTRTVRVQPSDVSCDGRLKLKRLIDYFQDTASMAVEPIEGTASELAQRGYAWVLSRYEIDFTGKMPSIDEYFDITTFHDPSHGYNTLRIFKVTSKGNLIIHAKSSWFLVDIKAGRVVKALAHLPEIMTDAEEINPDFREIPDFEEVTGAVKVPVTYHALDYNSHVNNAVYFEWLFDALPDEVQRKDLKSISASFRSGLKLGEDAVLEFNAGEDITNFRLIKNSVKKPSAIFSIHSRWN
ncbi:MAG: hypothetical protein IJ697_07210 [Synergistaceae bacterium]|nr:hypothetical protein [Synergistaceae bacterium]